MLVVIDVVFDLTGSFSLHCFSMSSLTLLWAMAGVFTPLFILSAQPSQSDSRHFHFNFSRLFIFTASATVLSEHFLPTGVFYPTLLRLSLRWGQEHPIQDPPLCLPSQNCPFRRMHGFELFMFELQDHWFINCASESRNIEPKLNYWMCFACSKSYEKTIKTLLTRLDVLLKTASTSQQSYFKKTATQEAS